MKKFVVMLLVVTLCLTMVCPALAAENDFVPSVTYKPMPRLVGPTDENGMNVGQTDNGGVVYLNDGFLFVLADGVHDGLDENHKCLVVTPLSEAETSTEIPDEAEEMLLWVYDQILTNGMSFFEGCEGLQELIEANLGAGKTVQDLVVKDLYDVSVLCEPLEAYLEPEGTTICLDFDLNLAPGTFVTVLTYKGGQWKMIENVELLENGTVTCTVYENFCPVAILVNETDGEPVIETVNTGDISNMGLWLAVAAASLAAIVVCIIGLNKSKKNAA